MRDLKWNVDASARTLKITSAITRSDEVFALRHIIKFNSFRLSGTCLVMHAPSLLPLPRVTKLTSKSGLMTCRVSIVHPSWLYICILFLWNGIQKSTEWSCLEKQIRECLHWENRGVTQRTLLVSIPANFRLSSRLSRHPKIRKNKLKSYKRSINEPLLQVSGSVLYAVLE